MNRDDLDEIYLTVRREYWHYPDWLLRLCTALFCWYVETKHTWRWWLLDK